MVLGYGVPIGKGIGLGEQIIFLVDQSIHGGVKGEGGEGGQWGVSVLGGMSSSLFSHCSRINAKSDLMI